MRKIGWMAATPPDFLKSIRKFANPHSNRHQNHQSPRLTSNRPQKSPKIQNYKKMQNTVNQYCHAILYPTWLPTKKMYIFIFVVWNQRPFFQVSNKLKNYTIPARFQPIPGQNRRAIFKAVDSIRQK